MITINLTNRRYMGYILVEASFTQASDYSESSLTSGYSGIDISSRRACDPDSSGYWTIIHSERATRRNAHIQTNFSIIDYLSRNDYEYVYKVDLWRYSDDGGYYKPQVLDPVSGEYVDDPTMEKTATVYSIFDCVVMYDKVSSFFTPLNAFSISLNTQSPYVMNTTLFSKKPSMFINSMTNYIEGECKGVFLDIKSNSPDGVLDPDNFEFDVKHNWEYRAALKRWLCNGCAKFIKDTSGDCWIVGIKKDTITDTGLFSDAEIEGARQISFGWFEIGEYIQEDLEEFGLVEVDEYIEG